MSTGWGPPAVPPTPPARDASGESGPPAAPAPLPAWTPPPPVAAGDWGGPALPGPTVGTPAPDESPVTPPTTRRSRRRLLAFLLLVAVGAGAAWQFLGGDSDPVAGEWTRHELPSGAVSVELPGATTSDSGAVWSGGTTAISGSAIWTGDGGYERSAPGIVVLEGDAAQLGLTPEVLATGSTALLDAALTAYLTEIGADPAPTLDDRVVEGRPTRQAFSTADDGNLAIVAVATVDGTRVLGVVVTTRATDETTPAEVAERVVTSLRSG